MRKKVLYLCLALQLVLFLLLGFFAFPVGMPLCAALVLYYGLKKKDTLLLRIAIALMLVAIAVLAYTLLVISSM